MAIYSPTNMEAKFYIFSRVHATLYVTMLVGPSEITSRFLAFRAKRRADFSYFPCPTLFASLKKMFHFLVACTRLYMSLCRSVGPSVRRSVITSRFWAFRAKRRADFSYCPCPSTILPLPTRTRLMLPCILGWKCIACDMILKLR